MFERKLKITHVHVTLTLALYDAYKYTTSSERKTESDVLVWFDVDRFHISQFTVSAFNSVIVHFYGNSSCLGFTSHYSGIESSDLETQSASITWMSCNRPSCSQLLSLFLLLSRSLSNYLPSMLSFTPEISDLSPLNHLNG